MGRSTQEGRSPQAFLKNAVKFSTPGREPFTASHGVIKNLLTYNQHGTGKSASCSARKLVKDTRLLAVKCKRVTFVRKQ